MLVLSWLNLSEQHAVVMREVDSETTVRRTLHLARGGLAQRLLLKLLTQIVIVVFRLLRATG